MNKRLHNPKGEQLGSLHDGEYTAGAMKNTQQIQSGVSAKKQLTSFYVDSEKYEV